MTNKNEILSAVWNNGQKIVETIYNATDQETHLAVFEDGRGRADTSVKGFRDDEFSPLPPETDFIKTGLLRLPSSFTDYGSPVELYERIKKYLVEYSQLDDGFVTLSSVYVLLTWVYDRFRTVPYLRAIGLPGTGKSRFLEVMSNICYKGVFCAGAVSTSAMFRLIDATRGTLVLDEAEFENSQAYAEITRILNGGHSKGGVVTKSEPGGKKGSFVSRSFAVFGPKVFATRTRFGDQALESRCLTKAFLPLASTDKPVHLPMDFETKSIELRNQLLQFRADYFLKISDDPESVSKIKSPRLKQVCLALTSIAKQILPEVYEELVSFLESYEDELTIWQGSNDESDVLLCIANLIQNQEVIKGKKIYMGMISHYYNENLAEGKTNRYGGYSKDEITARKAGSVVDNLNLRKKGDGKGKYLPLDSKQLEAITLLIQRYGLESAVNAKKPEISADEDEILF